MYDKTIINSAIKPTNVKKYQLKFRLENLPGVGTMEMVAGECTADSPTFAGKKLEQFLQTRIGYSKYKYLAEAKIVDMEGKECAFLQIDISKGKDCTLSVPHWGTWLMVY